MTTGSPKRAQGLKGQIWSRLLREFAAVEALAPRDLAAGPDARAWYMQAARNVRAAAHRAIYPPPDWPGHVATSAPWHGHVSFEHAGIATDAEIQALITGEIPLNMEDFRRVLMRLQMAEGCGEGEVKHGE